MTLQEDFVLEKINQIKQIVNLPEKYHTYNELLLKQFHSIYSISSKARWVGIDPNILPESEITIDIADRVSGICDPQTETPINTRLRELLKTNRQEIAALKIAEEIAIGKFGLMEPEEALKTAVRVGLAVMTEGVTVAPIQGLSDVTIRQNRDGTQYACLFFAGPMRSAGGTESAFTVVLADRVRKTMNLSTYQPYSFGFNEPERILEELRIYERYQSFQFKVSDDSILETVRRLPVEINGVETEQQEVVTHRVKGEKSERITTNRLRGGALRVINDGIIGKTKKLSKLIKDLNISGWDWLEDIDSINKSDTNTKNKKSHFNDVISGRPVLSVPEIPGGFRLRYGKSFNTGHATIGVHPASSAIFSYPIVVGTQVKTNIPGKASTIAFVDTIEGPRVLLKDGSVVHLQDREEATRLKSEIKRVLYLGDVLISYGDFLENNSLLHKSAYVEEIWIHDLKEQWEKEGTKYPELKETIEKLNPNTPSFETIKELSIKLKTPLHPRFLFFWDRLSHDNIIYLREKLQPTDNFIRTLNNKETKHILELAGIPHTVQAETLIIAGETAKAVSFTLNLQNLEIPITSQTNTCKLLTSLCGIQINEKSAVSVGIRVGRPEKSALRRMTPAVECLFPIEKLGGLRSDIIQASKYHTNPRDPQTEGKILMDIVNSYCETCNEYNPNSRCNRCKNQTSIRHVCTRCNKNRDSWKCPKCKIQTVEHGKNLFDLKKELENASLQTKYHPRAPFKGVEGLLSEIKYPEPLVKGLLRNKHNLSMYRDGTIRIDMTNAPLTHANAKMINTKITKLKELGYTEDIHGNPLVDENQIFELFIQDIVIPDTSALTLLDISKFTDDLLKYVYKTDPYYNHTKPEDLIGELLVGLAPHTSVGVVGRIIGFTSSQVCFAHPYLISARRRDADGDADAGILLMDLLLNFSKEYLPAAIGGLMDAPLLLQPIVLPKEVQRQARNMDVMKQYPKEFYTEISSEVLPTDLKTKIQTTEEYVLSDSVKQFTDFHFTHFTSDISIGPPRTSYIEVRSINTKIERQLDIAEKVDAVNPNEVVKSLINTHLLPDIIGNSNAYLRQKFRCKNRTCEIKNRRMPLKGKCFKCGGKLQATVTKGSAMKYLPIVIKLSQKYDLGDYLTNRINLLAESSTYLFPSGRDKDQTELTAFV